MNARLSAGGRQASSANDDYPTVDREGFDREIAAAVRRMRHLGISPADDLALFRTIAGTTESGRADWSLQQKWAAYELALLYTLRELLRRRTVATEMVLELAFAYAQIRQYRTQDDLHKMIVDMAPDYRRGKKVREAGQRARGSWLDRYRQAEEFRRIERELSNRIKALKRSRSLDARCRDIAKEYCSRYPGKSVSSKTVSRRLREFPVPLQILEIALRRKLI